MSGEYCIAADIGGTNVRAALIDRDYVVRHKLKAASGSDPLPVLKGLISELIACSDAEIRSGLSGLGIAVAGIVDKSGGSVLRSPNIPSISGSAIRREFSSGFDLKVFVENDASAAAFGEKVAGAARDLDDFVMLTLGTGIGGGIVYNGKLLHAASEIGHMAVVANSGLACGCGSTGCLEAYASASAIAADIQRSLDAGVESSMRNLDAGLSVEAVYRAAAEGDSLAKDALSGAGRYLGIGIANIINIFGPQAVILTGGLTGAWDIYIRAATEEAQKRAMPELFKNTEIMRSALGDDAGLTGIAALVFEGRNRAV